ncbi:rhodanese-like domain-containing protein [Streptomyces sp. NPDC054833]
MRPAEEYAAGHVPGALSIPVGELPDRIAEVPRDAEVVAYCRGACCVLAHEAVRLMHAHGRRAVRLTDGMLEWRLADRAHLSCRCRATPHSSAAFRPQPAGARRTGHSCRPPAPCGCAAEGRRIGRSGRRRRTRGPAPCCACRVCSTCTGPA